jgi:hypothetical protein
MDSSSLHRDPCVKGEADVSRHKADRSESKNGQFGWYHGTRKRLPSHLGREVFCFAKCHCEGGDRPPEAISAKVEDCFVRLSLPRNDRTKILEA